jgi:protein-disulfide isomerase
MRKMFALAALTLLGVYAQAPAKKAVKPAASAPAPAFDKVQFAAYVRHLLAWGDFITVAVGDPTPSPLPGYRQVLVTGSFQKTALDELFYVSPDGKTLVRGKVFDIAKSPFADELSKLKTDLQPSLGTAGAPVVIVEFSDFQCPFCREEAKALRENLLKTYPSEVRLYFKDYPLDQIHNWAKPAALAGRCVFRQEPALFWEYHDWIFDKQREITAENLKEKTAAWAQGKALDALQFGRCVETRSTEAEVDRSVAEARALKINSTPTLFINGRAVSGAAWPELKAYIDFELDHAKKTGQGGEQCCTLTLPVPGAGKK